MRKIISREEDGKKRKRNQILLGGALVLIMVMSVLGYSWNRDEDKTEKMNYFGFTFTKVEGGWELSMNKNNFLFRYNPKEVPEMDSSLNLLNSYKNKPLYIYSESAEASADIYKNLGYLNRIVERVQEACLEEECEEGLPLKTCSENFIIIKEGDENKMEQQDNCVFIEGKKEDLAKLGDSFLFKILGVQ